MRDRGRGSQGEKEHEHVSRRAYAVPSIFFFAKAVPDRRAASSVRCRSVVSNEVSNGSRVPTGVDHLMKPPDVKVPSTKGRKRPKELQTLALFASRSGGEWLRGFYYPQHLLAERTLSHLPLDTTQHLQPFHVP